MVSHIQRADRRRRAVVGEATGQSQTARRHRADEGSAAHRHRAGRRQRATARQGTQRSPIRAGQAQRSAGQSRRGRRHRLTAQHQRAAVHRDIRALEVTVDGLRAPAAHRQAHVRAHARCRALLTRRQQLQGAARRAGDRSAAIPRSVSQALHLVRATVQRQTSPPYVLTQRDVVTGQGARIRVRQIQLAVRHSQRTRASSRREALAKLHRAGTLLGDGVRLGIQLTGEGACCTAICRDSRIAIRHDIPCNGRIGNHIHGTETRS